MTGAEETEGTAVQLWGSAQWTPHPLRAGSGHDIPRWQGQLRTSCPLRPVCYRHRGQETGGSLWVDPWSGTRIDWKLWVVSHSPWESKPGDLRTGICRTERGQGGAPEKEGPETCRRVSESGSVRLSMAKCDPREWAYNTFQGKTNSWEAVTSTGQGSPLAQQPGHPCGPPRSDDSLGHFQNKLQNEATCISQLPPE